MDFVDGNGESQFRVGIPYLEDAAGEVLNDVAVSVEREGALYVVTYTPDEAWLTFETDKLSVSASTKDKNASYRVEGGNNLAAGADNEIRIIGIAENGSEKIYTVIVKRAADPNAETVVLSSETEAIPVTEPKPITEPEETTIIEPDYTGTMLILYQMCVCRLTSNARIAKKPHKHKDKSRF